ncbi:MAG: cell division protein FtsA [Verrucomicrobia bacterium ADurb.Bin345]|nr:MAG: cell division protein FtsA [Verrucomicrobia bacterium ADurb.Bin345]
MLKQERILALDIGASGLKIAEFTPLKSGGIELTNFGVASLGMDPQGDADKATYITTTIRELMQDHGIGPGPVLMSVSGQSVFLRFVKLPPVDKDKVYQIILYEAQQNVPFPMDEVVWDHQLIGGQSGEIDVMLAAIKAEIIEQTTDAVEAASLDPELVDVAPMALYNAVRYNYPELPECTLVIDIGARSTDLIFLEEGRVFSRSVPVAGNAITQQIMHEFGLSFGDAEELKRAHAFVAFGGAYEGPKSEVVDKVSKSVRSVMTRLHAEINRSVNFYRSQQAGRQPGLVLLTGGTSVIPYTDTFLKDKMHVDVDYLNPFLNVAVSERIEAEEIARVANLMGQVVGLALRRALTCPIEVNLMPPKVLADKAFRRKQPIFITAAIGVLLIMAVWCAYFIRMARMGEERLGRIRMRVDELQQVESRLSEAETRLQDVRGRIDRLVGLVDSRTRWLSVLDRIHENLPDGMWLSEIKPLVETTPAPDPAAPPTATMVTGVEVAGYGYRDKIPPGNPIRDYRERLRGMSEFSESTDVIWQPTPAPDDFVIQFKLRIELKESISI